jgi:ABC-type sulfate/molybdate transport systems ATPase subunit/ABC-type transporter Mla maintaining outer membrane lipid asymmetry permease subunit MlaE
MSDRSQKSDAASSACDIVVDQLTLTAGDKTLLSDVSARFRGDRITLIVGPSGAGKSLLLKIIAGLLPANDPGVNWRGGVQVGNDAARAGLCGVVFQQFALFDELSPQANVMFALAHRQKSIAISKQERSSALSDSDQLVKDQSRAKELLVDLKVPSDVRTSQLSGGQRQRLAIARALAYQPRAILYDEPTSGLDLGTARKVASLIRETQQKHHVATMIVTHDYESLLPIADEVYFLDPSAASLIHVPNEDWKQLPQRLEAIAQSKAPSTQDEPEQKPLNWMSAMAQCLIGTSYVVEESVKFPVRLIPFWPSYRWGLRYFLHYARLVFGPTAWIYLMVSGWIIGFVGTYFIFRFLPFASYTEPLLIDDLLLAIGFSLYRFLVPVLATVLIAARCGAAVASDVGSKQYGHQLSALKSFGANPHFYLLNNVVWAFLIGTPLLTMLAFYAAKWTCLTVFTFTHLEYGAEFWNLHFHRKLVHPDHWFYIGSGWLVAKLLTCGAGVALISYFRGAAPKYSSIDVSDAVTSTILWATIYVLVVHFVFAFWEF